MATTLSHTLNNEDWTLVSEGYSNVAIQLGNQGRILIHVAESGPAPLAAGIAIGNTTAELPKTFSISNLPLTSKVYCLSLGDDPMSVTVLSY